MSVLKTWHHGSKDNDGGDEETGHVPVLGPSDSRLTIWPGVFFRNTLYHIDPCVTP